MKLQTIRRSGLAAVAVVALSGLAACGSSDDNSASNTPAAGTSSSAAGGSSSSAADPASQTFGPACSKVPTDPNDPGSFQGMVQDPVATAASNNPILTQLVGAVGAVQGLGDTLNSAPALTVFAPYDGAFEAVPAATMSSLAAGAKKDGTSSTLAKILEHHVLGANDDPSAVVGQQKTLAGDTLTISGDPQSGMTVSDGTVTANVLCGNIPTANATVYVIDKVLTGVK